MNDIIELIDRIKHEVGAAKSLEENVAALRVELEEESGKLTEAKSNLALLTAELAARTTLGETPAKDEAPASSPRRQRVRRAEAAPAASNETSEPGRGDAAVEVPGEDSKATESSAQVEVQDVAADVASSESTIEEVVADALEPDASESIAAIVDEVASDASETTAVPIAAEQMIAEGVASGDVVVDQPVRASSDDVSLFEDGGVELPDYEQSSNETFADPVEAATVEATPADVPAEATAPKATSFRRPSFLQQKG